MKRQVRMELVKETKGALRYEGVGDDNPKNSGYMIGTLYLRKAAVGQPFPRAIDVTVETSAT